MRLRLCARVRSFSLISLPVSFYMRVSLIPFYSWLWWVGKFGTVFLTTCGTGQHDVAVRELEALIKSTTAEHSAASKVPSAAGAASGAGLAGGRASDAAQELQVESKWVDLLIKAYIQVGRVGDAVMLTDQQLARTDAAKEPLVHARVAMTVFPWRMGAAMWHNIEAHYEQLVRASERTLELSPQEVPHIRMRDIERTRMPLAA